MQLIILLPFLLLWYNTVYCQHHISLQAVQGATIDISDKLVLENAYAFGAGKYFLKNTYNYYIYTYDTKGYLLDSFQVTDNGKPLPFSVRSLAVIQDTLVAFYPSKNQVLYCTLGGEVFRRQSLKIRYPKGYRGFSSALDLFVVNNQLIVTSSYTEKSKRLDAHKTAISDIFLPSKSKEKIARIQGVAGHVDMESDTYLIFLKYDVRCLRLGKDGTTQSAMQVCELLEPAIGETCVLTRPMKIGDSYYLKVFGTQGQSVCTLTDNCIDCGVSNVEVLGSYLGTEEGLQYYTARLCRNTFDTKVFQVQVRQP